MKWYPGLAILYSFYHLTLVNFLFFYILQNVGAKHKIVNTFKMCILKTIINYSILKFQQFFWICPLNYYNEYYFMLFVIFSFKIIVLFLIDRSRDKNSLPFIGNKNISNLIVPFVNILNRNPIFAVLNDCCLTSLSRATPNNMLHQTIFCIKCT